MFLSVFKYLGYFCSYFSLLYLDRVASCEDVNINGLSCSPLEISFNFNFNKEHNFKDGCCMYRSRSAFKLRTRYRDISRYRSRSTCRNPTFASRIVQKPSFPGLAENLCGKMGDQRTITKNVPCDDVIRNVRPTVTSLAVVPYNEEKILPHEKPSRSFTIGDFKFHIDQKWSQLGVAAVVWDAAEVLAQYLHQHPFLVQGKRVVELGAGTGLTGLLAAALGGAVTVTERHAAMEHLIYSVQKNSAGTQWDIKAKELDWTELPDKESLGHFDIILGADVIYIEDTFSDLLKTIETFSEDANTLVLLSCRIRYERDRHFLKLLENSFDVEEIFYHSERDIHVFSARRKEQ